MAELGPDQCLSGSVSYPRGVVELEVVLDDGLQERLDDRYGDGTVDVRGRLQPVT